MTQKGLSQKEDQGKYYREAAEGLWQRFKEMVMLRKRLENYVFMPETNPEEKVNGWLDHLLDEGQVKLLATELTLRAFRVAVEAINYKILVRLQNERSVSISMLAELTGLPDLLVGERVNDLVQVGLALRSIENDQVNATLLADSLLGIIGETTEELTRNVRDRLPGVMEK